MMMTPTQKADKTQGSMTSGSPIGAAEYFRTKLQFETTPHDLKRDMESGKVVLLDVRDEQSYKTERIPGAKNTPLTHLERHLAELPKNKTLVTYCWNITCAASTKAALILAEKGFQVQELVGGIGEWKTKFPTESSK